jgi:hypothetical protein
VANPKFAKSFWSSAASEFRIQSHTGKHLNSSVVLDLKFLNADAAKMAGTSNPPHQAGTVSVLAALSRKA